MANGGADSGDTQRPSAGPRPGRADGDGAVDLLRGLLPPDGTGGGAMPSVYLIVEVRAYGEALGQALRGEGLEVSGMAAHPLEALSGIRTATPDVALLDVAEPLGPPWAREIV